MRNAFNLLCVAVTLSLSLPVSAADEKPIKALLILGGCCHDYANQQKILAEGIAARANVEVTVAYDPDKGTTHLNPVYQNKDWAKGYDVIIHDECSSDMKDLDVIQNTILKPHKGGLPAVVLHCGMHCYRSEGWPKVVTPWFEFTGLQTTGHGAQKPIAVTYVDKESPITRGLENWTTINEELYNNIAGKVLDTAHPLARGKQGKDDTVVVWTNVYNGKTKVFATTLGHNNQTVADARYLDLVTRGLLWTLGKLDEQHLKPAPKDKQAAAPGAGGDAKSPFAPDAEGKVPVDLARGKAATASSYQQDGEGHPAVAAVDGDSATRWCARDDSAPQWLQLDLGAVQDVIGCRITWEHDAAYQYRLEGSTDGRGWKTLAEESSEKTDSVREHLFEACCGGPAPGDGLRYLRLNVTGLQPGSWASVYELEVFGKQRVKPTASVASSVSRPERKALAGLKAPEGFELTVFAAPPDVNYPTCLTTAPTGEVFVGVDEMGSLGRKPGRGRVVRCVDADGDGRADRFTDFAKMDHPRGLIWDGATRTLYVLHPPFLTAYHDDNGDGVADRSEDLVNGVANEKAQAERGADHTTNGIRLGIDGWIYIAMGDFGCTDAVGNDGTHLTKHGGGIVRVRPDGSGLEEYTRGQRNIYDVAIDPFMNAFTRDNTNDGDGWDVRLSYIVPTGNYGYPSLFKNFPDEIVKPLLDLGGGSPCGSLYVDEPNLPGDSGRMLYTVEWGRNAVMRHPLTPDGAGFKAKEEKWFDLPRGTDMDVDGRGRFYVSSWANGGFDYSGPDVGYVVRLAPKAAKPAPFPDMKALGDDELVLQLASRSGVCRMAAQREIVARGKSPAPRLEHLAQADVAIEARVAAVFTLGQLQADLAGLASRPELAESVLRVLADRPKASSAFPGLCMMRLGDSDPRVRLLAAWGLGRLGDARLANRLLPLLADADPLVTRVAVNSLVRLGAADACLGAVDSSTPSLAAGATRALQAMHEPRVVDGLINKLRRLDDPALRQSVYGALCRLAYKEADWDGGWWGTRPDTSGPYFKPMEWEETGKIKRLLDQALATERPEVVRSLVVELKRHKVDLPEASAVAAKLAQSDPSFRQVLVDLLASKRGFSPEDVSLLRGVALSDADAPALRARAVRLLAQENQNPAALDAVAEALAPIAASDQPVPELESVFEETVRDARFERQASCFAKLAESDSAAKRELGYAFLVNLASPRLNRDRDRGPSRAVAADAVERGWADPARSASLLRAIARTRASGYESLVVQKVNDSHPEVARAATVAAKKLRLNGTTAKNAVTVESLGFEKVAGLVRKVKGDAKLGAELFTRQGCVNCHTVSTSEPPKGPPLAGVAAKYNRAELCESVLKPSAKIAQGFETQWFKTRSGDVVEGFVTRESGDEIEFRNATGASNVLKKQDVERRGKRDISVMPEGLVGNLTPQEFASLLAYVESLKGK